MNPLQRLFNETFASSSNGKNADSESVNQGSNPCEASIKKREWLNTDEDKSAYVIVSGTWKQNFNKDSFAWVDVELKDCNRQINLDFSYDTEEEHREALRKSLQMMKTFQEVYEFILMNPYKPAENKS